MIVIILLQTARALVRHSHLISTSLADIRTVVLKSYHECALIYSLYNPLQIY